MLDERNLHQQIGGLLRLTVFSHWKLVSLVQNEIWTQHLNIS
jgi:hypothetical protein